MADPLQVESHLSPRHGAPTELEIEQQAELEEEQPAAQTLVAEVERTNQALRRTTGRLTQTQDLRQFLGEVLHEALMLLGADRGHLFIQNSEDDTFTYAAGAVPERCYLEPEPDEPAFFHSKFPTAMFPVYQILLETRRAAVMSRDSREAPPPPELARWFHESHTVEAVALALLAGEEPVGFIGLMFARRPELSPKQLEFFQAMANHAALAIRMTRLAEQAGRVAVAEERARLARDIHDSLGQVFAGISVQLEIAKRVFLRNPEKASDCLAEALGLARTGLAEVRRSVWALRPLDLDGGNLTEALRRLIERARRDTSAELIFRNEGAGALPPQTENELLRIAQEALSNSLRHARPRTVEVILEYSSIGVRLEVSDNGKGFNTTVATAGPGFGLVSMRERAARIGAVLTVDSDHERGTHVVVTITAQPNGSDGEP